MDIYQIRPELTPHYDPRGIHPHDIPTPGVFDEPTVKTCINEKWLSHLTGMMERMLYEDAWSGTEQEVYDAIESVRKIIAAFDDAANQGVCDVVAFIVGELRSFAFSSLPDGWLACDGAAVSRTTYADLFTAIGTTFGVGNGTTTFNVPDLRGRSQIGTGQGSGLTSRALAASGGEESHILTTPEIPSHAHSEHIATSTSGAGSTWVQADRTGGTGALASALAGGGGSHNNMPPFLAVVMAIYAGV